MEIKYLVFGGGGAAGYAYAGVIEALGAREDFSFEKILAVAGTSIGAVAALMVSLNYTPEEASKKIQTLDLSKFQDGGCLLVQMNRLGKKYGRYKGEVLADFVSQIIQEKTGGEDPENVTFQDLKDLGYKDLWVVATKLYKINDIPTGKQKVFSTKKTPKTSVLAAIRASTSAPYYFSRIRMKKIEKGKYVIDEQGDIYDDGGLFNNYPLDIFDKPEFVDMEENNNIRIVNPYSLGFVLLNKAQIYDHQNEPKETTIVDAKPIEFAKSVFNSLVSTAANKNLSKDNRDRTVQIDRLQVKLADFNIPPKKKAELIKSGRKAVNDYFINNAYANKPVKIGRLWDTSDKKRETSNESSLDFKKAMG